MDAAAKSADAVAEWQWLQGKGPPPVQGTDGNRVHDLALAATEVGHAEVLRHLLSLVPPGQEAQVFGEPRTLGSAAAASGSIPVAEILLQAGAAFAPIAYEVAYQPENGHEASMAMIRWLATMAGVRIASASSLAVLTQVWARNMPSTPAGRADLVQAVRLAVGGEGLHDWAAYINPFSIQLLMHQVHGEGKLGLAQFLVRVTRFET